MAQRRNGQTRQREQLGGHIEAGHRDNPARTWRTPSGLEAGLYADSRALCDRQIARRHA